MFNLNRASKTLTPQIFYSIQSAVERSFFIAWHAVTKSSSISLAAMHADPDLILIWLLTVLLTVLQSSDGKLNYTVHQYLPYDVGPARVFLGEAEKTPWLGPQDTGWPGTRILVPSLIGCPNCQYALLFVGFCCANCAQADSGQTIDIVKKYPRPR